MTIAEKLQLITENQQKVFEAGKKSGFVQDEDKIIRKTATGTGIVRLDDVSEIPHDIKIIAPNSEKVVVYGKNFITFPYNTGTKLASGVTWYVDGDGGITLSGTATAQTSFVCTTTCPFKDGVTYVIKDLGLRPRAGLYVYYTDGAGKGKWIGDGNVLTWSDSYTFKQIYLQAEKESVFNNEIIYPLITLADTEKDDGFYIKPVEYTLTDGEVAIKSNLPYLTVLADGEITVEYQKSYGAQLMYDQFWDTYQMGGTRESYNNAFYGSGSKSYGWTNDNFKPKYDIRAIHCGNMFYYARISGDLVKLLEKLGVALDTSQSTSFGYMFSQATFSRVGVIDTRSATTLDYVFGWSTSIHTIDKIILKEDGSQTFTSAFQNCTALTNLMIEGTIGQNGFDVSTSNNLTHDSLMSIINALQDKTADTSSTVWKVTIGSTNMAKLTEDEIALATSKGWEVA